MHILKIQKTSKIQGFSLPEMLVGMTVALITFLIISQVFSNFEKQKRVTAASTDAQSGGLVSLVQLEQDARSAGAGIVDSEVFSCANTYSYYESGSTVTSPVPGFGGNFAPVIITDGGATGSDTLQIRIASDFLGAIPTTITEDMPQGSAELKVTRAAGFQIGQVVMAVQGGSCTAMQITQVQGSPNHLQHNPGGNAQWNPTINFQNTNGWPGYTTGARIYTVGSITLRTYSINANNQLQAVTQLAGSTSTDILNSDIVSLQAQYGISSGLGVQDVSDWVEPTGTWAAAALDGDKIKRIKAIRIAIVARAARMENTNVSGTCTNISGTVNNGPCLWRDSVADPAPALDLSTNTDWQKYRYRSFQTIIPLRNIIWAQL